MWKFKPILKSTIWGGSRIIPFKRLDVRLDDVGESWEISGVPGMETVVESGLDAGLTVTQLVDKYGPALMGEKNYKKYGDDFPLLVKFIDARAELSVQVHPDDALAQRRGHKWGKTEMWYIVEAAKGARVASGFRTPVDPADYDSLVESGRIEDVLGYIDVRPGEVYMTPAGRVHAIGRGCFLVEIQQTSDLTYRIYDYHRRDSEGKERELHTELAREAIDFNDTGVEAIPYQQRMNVPVTVARTPYFITNVLNADTDLLRDYSESDTFVILVMVDGEAEITCGSESVKARRGQTLLVPASATGITITPVKTCRIIETYIK